MVAGFLLLASHRVSLANPGWPQTQHSCLSLLHAEKKRHAPLCPSASSMSNERTHENVHGQKRELITVLAFSTHSHQKSFTGMNGRGKVL